MKASVTSAMHAAGYSHRQIAERLNEIGYHTMGNRGGKLFSKDTVAGILRSRFYLGELPDGEYVIGQSRLGSYMHRIPAKHSPLVLLELWEAANNSTAGRAVRSVAHEGARTYSLAGLLVCAYCGGKMHLHSTKAGKTYAYCYNRGQGLAPECRQHGVQLSVYESQIEQYLARFSIPADYLCLLADAYLREDTSGPGFELQSQALNERLKRIKRMFEWGDLTDDEYREKRDECGSDRGCTAAYDF